MTSSRNSLPPWLEKAAQQLETARVNQRMPHAMLLHEAPGAGGALFATYAAQLLLCTGSTPACGQCRSCQRVARNEHPDFRVIVPDPELKLGQITVDQVRDLGQQLSLSSHEGAGTCVVITPAHALNRFSANALLKTLEEPRPGVLLILLTSSPSLLPATLRSRCLRLRLPAPDRETALAWLQAQRPSGREAWSAALDVLGMAPLEALEANLDQLQGIRRDVLAMLQDAQAGRVDVVRTAAQWSKDDLGLRLRCIENCLTGSVVRAPGVRPDAPELRAGAQLQTGGLDINIRSALEQVAGVRELQRQLRTSLNKTMALERYFWQLNSG
ncbi:MAG: DNA polymerase III subunit delta' [Pseudomonadota bacterium]